MAACPKCLLVAALGVSRPLAVVLAIGLLTLFVLLAVLVWTRFGQARPVSKCVILSLLAHLLLIIYAYSTRILYGPPGRWTGQIVTVRLRDAADDVEAASVKSATPNPWEQPGGPDGPLLLASPPGATEQESPQLQAKPESSPSPSPKADAAPLASGAEVAAARPLAGDATPPSAGPQPAATPHDQPSLTDLLPDRSGEAPPVNEPPPPTNPLREDVAAEAAETLAAEPEIAPAEQVRAEQNQFVTASKSLPRRLGDGQAIPEPLQARVAADRLKAAQPFGASPRTEAAVAAALDWLGSAQSSDGRWDADAHGAGRETRTVLGHDRQVATDQSGLRRPTGAQADTGVTGLALMAFLGSGETHLSGKHRQHVQRGLEFLLASQARDGNLAGHAELFAAMYCHGIATLALSEAYGLSGDDRLLPGLQRALQFTIQAQSAAGGWRYRPNEPSDPGDMSQFGWQLMALKSADLGGIRMPASTRERMARFLQSCSVGAGRGLAGYRPGERATRTMTAEALVCRYFLDSENSPAALDEGAAYVMEERPQQRSPNYYYWYYATLAMFQRQGDDWRRWNAAMQAELLARQRWEGAVAGSYDPDDLWGGYGGRVYSTALAALTLEVYYRYLPLHGHDLDDSRLTDRPWPAAVPR